MVLVVVGTWILGSHALRGMLAFLPLSVGSVSAPLKAVFLVLTGSTLTGACNTRLKCGLQGRLDWCLRWAFCNGFVAFTPCKQLLVEAPLVLTHLSCSCEAKEDAVSKAPRLLTHMLAVKDSSFLESKVPCAGASFNVQATVIKPVLNVSAKACGSGAVFFAVRDYIGMTI